MATVDPRIAMGFQPQTQITSPMNNLARLLQVQGAQQSNQLNQLKMDEYRSGVEQKNKLASLLGGQYDTDAAREDAVLRGGFIDEAQKLRKGRIDAAKGATDAEQSKLKLAMEKVGFVGQLLGGVKDQASYDQARAIGQQNGLDVSQMPPQYDPALVEQKRAQALSYAQQLEQEWKKKDFGHKERTQSEVERNNKVQNNISAGNLAVAQGNLAVNRDRLAHDKSKPTNQPGGRKPMTAAQEAKYREEFAKDYQAANTNLANMNEVLNSIEAVREAPGLNRVTGLASYLPSMPGGDAAAAEVKLKNLEGKITQLGKAAAAQGGAVGPMAVQEWKIVRDMIAAIDPAKGKDAMLQQIDLIEQSVIGAAERIKDTYSKQYSPDFEAYPQFQDLKIPVRGPKPKPKDGKPTPSGDGATVDWGDLK